MKILLLTGDTVDIDKGISSRDMLVSGLYYWLSKKEYEILIYNVNPLMNGLQSLESFLNELPGCDVLLVRLYTDSWVVQNIKKIKERLNCKTVSFIEHKQHNMDLTVAFLKSTNPDVYIPFPYVEKYMVSNEKDKGTILLDGQIEGMTEGCVLGLVTKWLKPLAKTYKIFQLGGKPLADYVELIPNSNYKSYMESTSRMEFFIQTHSGSYEHSIIDMVGRGIKTLMYPSLIPDEMVKDLELPTYKNQEELIDLIKTVKVEDKLNKMTPMEKVVGLLGERFEKL